MTRSVLITGASTGIGRATALRLVKAGWQVYAGMRDLETHAHWTTKAKVIPVKLDVRSDESVRSALSYVLDATGGRLHALVNNAGIPGAGPLEFLSTEAFADVMDVNVLGQVRVTREALAALRATEGRVVFMSSLSGKVAMPFLAPYAASKHAVEAIADSLRRETINHGIRVSVIEPGNIATPIWDKGLGFRDTLPAEAERVYRLGLEFATAQGSRARQSAIPADKVAVTVQRALSARRPQRRYVVGADARFLIPFAQRAPGALDKLLAIGMLRAGRNGAAPRAGGHDVKTPAF